jgi:hypothetical protein
MKRITSKALLLVFALAIGGMVGNMAKNLFAAPPENPYFWGVGGAANNTVGQPIASAATIAPDHYMHHVTGVTAIVTITPPWTGFTGPLVLFCDAIWTWTAAGNIQTAGTCTAGNQVPVTFYFDGTKWQPSRLS